MNISHSNRSCFEQKFNAVISFRPIFLIPLTLLCSSFPPTQAMIVLAMDVFMMIERGVAIATARAVIVHGLVNRLGLFIALVLASRTAFWASLR